MKSSGSVAELPKAEHATTQRAAGVEKNDPPSAPPARGGDSAAASDGVCSADARATPSAGALSAGEVLGYQPLCRVKDTRPNARRMEPSSSAQTAAPRQPPTKICNNARSGRHNASEEVGNDNTAAVRTARKEGKSR